MLATWLLVDFSMGGMCCHSTGTMHAVIVWQLRGLPSLAVGILRHALIMTRIAGLDCHVAEPALWAMGIEKLWDGESRNAWAREAALTPLYQYADTREPKAQEVMGCTGTEVRLGISVSA